MCYPNFIVSKFVAIFIFMEIKNSTFFLEFVSDHKKKNSPLLFLLHICDTFFARRFTHANLDFSSVRPPELNGGRNVGDPW